jgi:predicted TIM-barrel enzyme
MSLFSKLFPTKKPIIGMISLPPSLGYAKSPGVSGLIEAALADLDALERGDADGVLIENDFDQPHRLLAGAEVVAGLTRVATEVVARARVPVGVQVLLNDWRASLGIAVATGAQFSRLDFFVDRVQIKAGLIEPEPEAVMAYRRHLRGEHIALLTDIQLKRGRRR